MYETTTSFVTNWCEVNLNKTIASNAFSLSVWGADLLMYFAVLTSIRVLIWVIKRILNKREHSLDKKFSNVTKDNIEILMVSAKSLSLFPKFCSLCRKSSPDFVHSLLSFSASSNYIFCNLDRTKMIHSHHAHRNQFCIAIS